MKIKLLLSLFCIIGSFATTFAQNPKWFKKARKIQLTIITTDEKGAVNQGQGFFVNETGTVFAEYDLMKSATKATAVDAEGKEYDITHILGANSLYNVVKLETNNHKANTMPIASAASKENDLVYIMPICSNDKKAVCIIDTIKQVQEFGDDKQHAYYSLSSPLESRYSGCPVFNANGEILGHVQMPAGDNTKPAFVMSTTYGNSLSINVLDINNNDLKNIYIAKALPTEESQATSYILLVNRQDKTAYMQILNEFVTKFPNNHIGYTQLAEALVGDNKYKEAEEIYAKALQMNTGHDDEIHHSFATQLYQAGLQEKEPAEGWNMEHALKEAQTAYACNNQPLYTALEGMCLYAMKQYEASCEKFLQMGSTNMRSAEYFLYASQCKQMMKAPTEEILAMQDSAVNCYTKPYPKEATTALYLRAKTLASLNRNREAVNDMNEYEHILSGRVNDAAFYYEREQLEMQCRMFAAALTDIENAVRLQPQDALLRAEEAVVNYRIGEIDQAIAAANEAIRIDEKFPDPYRILGICLNEKGKKAEAKKALEKAKELGDTMAQSVLDKIK
ncbi:MAG: serine protease [Bacteroidaceae bacterium]|nr:serine protease [Bacteroidaceae bacterium]